jgi:uncharacterized protein with gpF-like domain
MSNEQSYQIKEKLAQLESLLTSQNPEISTILRDIHRNLKADPDLVTILTEQECAVLVSGLKKQTQTEISTVVAKKAKKDLKTTDLLDLL